MKSESSREGHELHPLYDHGKDLGGCGQSLETCGKILGISLSEDGWGCEGRRRMDLSTIPIPLESERSWWTLGFPFLTFLHAEIGKRGFHALFSYSGVENGPWSL